MNGLPTQLWRKQPKEEEEDFTHTPPLILHIFVSRLQEPESFSNLSPVAVAQHLQLTAISRIPRARAQLR